MIEIQATVDTVRGARLRFLAEYQNAQAKAASALAGVKVGKVDAVDDFEAAIRVASSAQMAMEVLMTNYGQYLSAQRVPSAERANGDSIPPSSPAEGSGFEPRADEDGS